MTSGSFFKLQLTLSVWGVAWVLSLLIRHWGHSAPLTTPPGPVLLAVVAGPGIVAAMAILSQWLTTRQNQSSRMK
ncbi:MAG: hypothetical protein TQ37_03555 [Candidatus Synechococcus spongiarum 15L]|uniref:Uncharacterized protein n=1 Tax=Candidatus Synechococcus spongiarum 15L TaxID=1608419 RepID=A0A0G8AWM9_9SYNE|nr:MAG: hypothetical protein TQ37_03555 [Candidatus Synechococcus spongiarum 15L]MCY4359682.1 hypothetical protein [Cyanobacteria bacterium MAG APA_bin_95]